MDEELAKKLLEVLISIDDKMPQGTEYYNFEERMDKLISTQNEQLDILNRILDRVGEIERNMNGY
jgi:hypothetical protein